MPVIWLGAFLVIAGVLLLAKAAIDRGRLSGTANGSPGLRDGTLEPEHRGVRFLGLAGNWPGLALIAFGAALLLFGAAI
ncbi:hypothetical protein SAMN04488498_12071 [Mesorhizobium albiziae]|uniref:Uncharacterized protein n=1 Tax=Neomesorhizobium albiziae TaxID=335020 RepID=A0A1I4DW08_9HYPH|nr:hypothetical protein [Mesorhizobium albiziae]GLS32725.1 hypothetical protein GCM10007937_44350 [Mesorhizobium albiziae]SFK97782.1 hypothetical protein SAMN04488498_12071 [Mesorhizobium albiziae]